MLELRHAVRRLARTPGFTAAVVLTLTLCIAANATLFTFVDRILLAPLPYPAPDRLVTIEHLATGAGTPSRVGTSRGLAQEYARLEEIEAVALYLTGLQATAAGTSTEAERIAMMRVSPSFAEVFGVELAAGRWFDDADSVIDAPYVVILTHALAGPLFGDARAATGRLARIDGIAHEVIGVLSPGTVLPATAQALEPYRNVSTSRMGPLGSLAVARLGDGATPDTLRTGMNAVLASLGERFPSDPQAVETVARMRLLPDVQPLKARLLGNAGATLWMLMAAAGAMLLIACANLANLFLVRADSRRGEWAVRRALGATRVRTLAGFAWESLLVTTAGGLLGIIVAHWTVQWLSATIPFDLPRVGEVRPGGAAPVLALLASVVLGLVFAALPLLRRGDVTVRALQETSHGSTEGVGRIRWRHALVAAQVGLSVVLLIAAGLLTRSLVRIVQVDPGFVADGRLTFELRLQSRIAGDRHVSVHESLMERLGALPGVRSAGVATIVPLQGEGARMSLEVRGRQDSGLEMTSPWLLAQGVSAEYLRTMGIPLLRGRTFTDQPHESHAVLVNQALVDAYFPAEDPLGKDIRRQGAGPEVPWWTIVGVAGNTVTTRLDEGTPIPQLYLPLRLAPQGLRAATYIVQSDINPTGLVPAIRQVQAEVAPDALLLQPELLTSTVTRANARMSFSTLLMSLAAGVGFLLGALGIYSLVAYAVALRGREIALRQALGADRRSLTWMIVRQSVVPVVSGLTLGAWGAAAAGRALAEHLYRTAWYDPVTYVGVTAGLLAVAVLASWLPAFRAASASPVRLLR
jgi:putative ABC transport system permease protein